MPSPAATCPKCGKFRLPSARKCSHCGAAVETAPSPPPGEAGPAFEEPRMLGAGAPRFKGQADDRVHYLVPEAGKPVVVEPGIRFVIGRDLRASLVVRSTTVSRQHAEVDWEGQPPRALLREIKASHGTFLNGRPVTPGKDLPLRDGDEVRLGPDFKLLYRHVTPRELEHELNRSTTDGSREIQRPSSEELDMPITESVGAKMAPEPAPAATRGIDPEGDLAVVGATRLLEDLHLLKCSGVLTVFDADRIRTGEAVLRDGAVLSVKFGDVTGLPALEAIAVVARGAYRFRSDPGSQPPPPRTALPPLVEAASRPQAPPPGWGSPGPTRAPTPPPRDSATGLRAVPPPPRDPRAAPPPPRDNSSGARPAVARDPNASTSGRVPAVRPPETPATGRAERPPSSISATRSAVRPATRPGSPSDGASAEALNAAAQKSLDVSTAKVQQVFGAIEAVHPPMKAAEVARLVKMAALGFLGDGDCEAVVQTMERLVHRAEAYPEDAELLQQPVRDLLDEDHLEVLLDRLGNVLSRDGVRIAGPLARRLVELTTAHGTDVPGRLKVRLTTLSALGK